MAKTDLEQLVVSLEANIKQYEKELARASSVTVRELRKIEDGANKSVGYLEKRMNGLGVSMKAGFAGLATVAVAALASVAQSAIKDAAAIGDLSDKLGISTDKLQELNYGAAQANMSFDDLGGGLLKFSKNIGEAANHSGELYKILSLNGIAVTNAAGKQRPLNDLLNDFADLVKNAKSEQEGLALVYAAFGKGSDGFLEMLRNGSSGLKDVEEAGRRAGIVIDEDLIRKAQEFDDTWAAVMLSVKAHTEEATLKIAALLEGAGGAVQGILKDANEAYNFAKKVASGVPTNGTQVEPDGFGGFNIVDSRPSNNPMADPSAPVSASGKGNLGPVPSNKKPTVLPDPEADARKKASDADKKRREKEAHDLAVRKAEAIKAVIEALALEEANLSRSNVQQRIANELKAAGTTADTKAGEQIIAKVQAISLEDQAMESAAYTAEQLAEKQQAFFDGISFLAETGVNAFDALIVQGQSLDDVLQNVLKSLVSATIQAAALGQGPLAGLFGTQSSSGGLGGLFGMLLGGLNPSTPASIYHSGGTVGMGGLSRSVHPGMFSGAPRYHSGGIAGLQPGEMPAILQKGEVVIPKGGMRGGGGLNVQIIDQRTNAPPVEQQKDGSGNLRFVIRDEVRRTIGSGDANKVMGGQFGAKPMRTKRG